MVCEWQLLRERDGRRSSYGTENRLFSQLQFCVHTLSTVHVQAMEKKCCSPSNTAHEPKAEWLPAPAEESVVLELEEELRSLRDGRLTAGLSLIPLTPERKKKTDDRGDASPVPEATSCSAERKKGADDGRSDSSPISEAPSCSTAAVTSSALPRAQHSPLAALNKAELASRISFLKRVFFFRDWESADLGVLANLMYQKRYGPHQTIVRQGASASALHLIRDGTCRVIKWVPKCEATLDKDRTAEAEDAELAAAAAEAPMHDSFRGGARRPAD